MRARCRERRSSSVPVRGARWLAPIAAVLIVASSARAQDRAASRVEVEPRRAVAFSKAVAPILFAPCTPCHRSGGGSSITLLRYADARPRATAIATLTARRVMPPWKPDAGVGHFAGARRLSQHDIDVLQTWV